VIWKREESKINFVSLQAIIWSEDYFFIKVNCSASVRHASIYAELFEFALGQFPISYLGILIHFWRLTNAECKHVEETV
jgi:hypothetical protein